MKIYNNAYTFETFHQSTRMQIHKSKVNHYDAEAENNQNNKTNKGGMDSIIAETARSQK